MFLLQLVFGWVGFLILRGEKASYLMSNFWMSPVIPVCSRRIPPVLFLPHTPEAPSSASSSSQLRCRLLFWTQHLTVYFPSLFFALWRDMELINFSTKDGKHFALFFIIFSSSKIIPPASKFVVCISFLSLIRPMLCVLLTYVTCSVNILHVI